MMEDYTDCMFEFDNLGSDYLDSDGSCEETESELDVSDSDNSDDNSDDTDNNDDKMINVSSKTRKVRTRGGFLRRRGIRTRGGSTSRST